jgi:hypothetical protein
MSGNGVLELRREGVSTPSQAIGRIIAALLCCWTRTIEMPAAGAKCMCAELKALKREAVHVFRDVKQIRWSRDVSFYEDAELNREKHQSINAVLKHLLVGHEGKPCPAGNRPIVSLAQLRR